MPQNLLPEIRLDDDAQKKLATFLEETGAKFEEFHSTWEMDHADYLKWYLTEGDGTSNDPWPGAFDLFLPLIRVGVDGLMAQFYDSMLSNDPFIKVRAVKDEAEGASEDLSLYYGEYFYKKQVPFKSIASDLLFDTLLDGTGAVKTRFDRTEVLRRELLPEVRTKPTSRQTIDVLSPEGATGGFETRFREEVRIERRNKILLDNTDMAQLFVPPDAGPSLQWPDCEHYYERHWLTWGEVLAKKREGWSNIDDTLKAFLEENEVTDKDRIAREADGLAPGTTLPKIEVQEWYMRLVLPAEIKASLTATREKVKQEFMDEDGRTEECIVTYFPRAKRIARVVPLDRIRPDNERPHVEMRYSRLPRFFYGMGIPASMWQIQSAMNSAFNQQMNYGELQNLPWGFFEPSSIGDMGSNFFLGPGQLIPSLNPSGVSFPRFQGDPSFWQMAMNTLFQWFERGTAVTDLAGGVAPSRPNAPRTARGTMALIGQSQIAFTWKVSQIANEFLRIFRQVHALHERYISDEVNFEFFNKGSQAFEKRTLHPSTFRQSVDFEFVLNPNRLQEQQTNQVLFSMLAPILGQILGPQALRPMAQDLWEGHGKKNFDAIWPSEGIPQVQTGQPPPPGMGQPAQEGGPVSPPPGQPPLDMSNLTAFLGGMGPQAPPAPEAVAEGPELEPDEEGATLQ